MAISFGACLNKLPCLSQVTNDLGKSSKRENRGGLVVKGVPLNRFWLSRHNQDVHETRVIIDTLNTNPFPDIPRDENDGTYKTGVYNAQYKGKDIPCYRVVEENGNKVVQLAESEKPGINMCLWQEGFGDEREASYVAPSPSGVYCCRTSLLDWEVQLPSTFALL